MIETIIGVLIVLILLGAALAIAYWAMRQFNLPQPAYVVFVAVGAILALLVILWLVSKLGVL